MQFDVIIGNTSLHFLSNKIIKFTYSVWFFSIFAPVNMNLIIGRTLLIKFS